MEPGTLVGDRFVIARRTGQGGLSTVFLAHDRARGGAPVALKILRHYGAFEDASRFRREADLLASLSHPGIVRYVAHGTTADGTPWLAMEWLEGEDLAMRLRRTSGGAMPATDAVTLVASVADALSVAHARGIVHRDLKPSNLFLPGGELAHVKILDFGIARLTAGPHFATRTGAVLGTPGYMAPEQARGERGITARADVFSLGCVLFECLTGRPPFEAEHLMAVLAKVLLHDPPRVGEVAPAPVPAALEALCAAMLAKDPARRPADGAALAAALAALPPLAHGAPHGELATLDTAALAPPSLTTGERRLLCVALAGATARVGGSVATTRTIGAGEPARQLGQMRDAAARAGAHFEVLADGSALVTLSSDGAPADQAARAARCALALRRAAPALPVALATGRAEVHGCWPVGEVIDRAARLLREARGDEEGAGVLIDELTATLLDAWFDVSRRRDDGAPVLRGERDATDAARTVLGRATPCVGRARELRVLADVFDECAEQPCARAVVVTGAAGMGKSRLSHELLRLVRERRPAGAVELWVARGDPTRAGSPFGIVAQAVRAAAGILDGEPLAVARNKLATRIGRRVPEPERHRVVEFLGEMVGVPFPDEGSPALRAARRDAMLMGDQMLRAFCDVLASAPVPLLVLVEDLHHGDLPSVKFLGAALRELRERPIMVLALARPEVHEQFPGLFAEVALQEVRLGPLPRRAALELVHAVLGAQVDPARAERLLERAGGNPFFLEELMRAVAHAHEPAGVTARDAPLPDSVLAVVQARIASLSPEARRVLRAASVFGQVFWRGGAEALLGVGGSEPPPAAQLAAGATPSGAAARLGEWLAVLVERELIVRRLDAKFPGEQEYAFRHALLREAAYAMLTDTDRALGHRLAGAWLLRAGERDALALAEHFEQGGEPARAARWYQRAAEQALGGNDLDAALARAARGEACARGGGGGGQARAGEPAGERDVLGALELLRAEVHLLRAEYDAAERAALAARAVLGRAGVGYNSATGLLAVALARQGKLDALEHVGRELGALLASGEALCGLLASAEPMGAAVMAAAGAAEHLIYGGRHSAARALLDQVDRLAARLASLEPAVEARVVGARAAWALFEGDPGRHLALVEAAAAAYERVGDARNAAFQRMNAGAARTALGAHREAEPALRDALRAAERMGLRALAAAARSNLALALLRNGALGEARAVAREAVALWQARGDRRMEGASRMYLAMVAAAQGDLADAEREAREAVGLLAAVPPLRAAALAQCARVLLAQGRVGDALGAAREASAAMAQAGAVEEGEGLVRLALAEALWAAGEAVDARRAIGEARARLLVRAAKIADGALRKSYLENVPDHARTLDLAREWRAEGW